VITFKQKLTAIKESVDKWDLIAHGKGEDMGQDNCALCHLFFIENNMYSIPGEVPEKGTCYGCPVYKKTGLHLCRGTPYEEYLYKSKRSLEAAGKFRDWLKDLYIEVSEKGEATEGKPRHTYHVEMPCDYAVYDTTVGGELRTLTKRVKDLEGRADQTFKEKLTLRKTQIDHEKRIKDTEKRATHLEIEIKNNTRARQALQRNWDYYEKKLKENIIDTLEDRKGLTERIEKLEDHLNNQEESVHRIDKKTAVKIKRAFLEDLETRIEKLEDKKVYFVSGERKK